ncbi:adenylosuccinate synthase [Enterocloster clostridioformis]|uniref:adenylosuccinate synthase n=1 Tax=Enterocloster clostridioformis TaxID=1531 RepID=UPI00080CAB19|nr:adenylosuccinate synthase [Enterocloster clostridioformis]ANU50143.1 adenylosuccinate synthase [Lachnoclostridium sp. YL32]NDO28359.1 adenylosuccinate synthase [Enterocloster clostridioformis]OXE70793.1 adenylosuccinate synthase [Enterocloster clostridioformis]QQR00954.1 adenylosuccinate synthase [Enterocloster clostridioformis]
MVRAIVGANWGDEGKGKITDMLAKESDIIIRFQGGSNAGHTIINDYGKFALHLLPSGVFYQHTTSIIGNGVALNIPYLIQEIESLVERGVPKPRILVSDRAQILMPYHVLFDTYEEARLAGKSFGSTKSGIAPFYSDKYAKIGFQVSELFAEDLLREKAYRVCELKNVLLEHLYHKPLLDPEEIIKELLSCRDMIAPYVCDTSAYLHEAIKEGRNILLEGQLGSLKDPDHGIYPMVTSSSTLAAYGAIGAGIPPYEIKDITTVVKAYSSAVGAGAFVSEIFGDEADELRNRGGDGGEYGATTGRPRRVGWFDAVATRYGCRIQGTTEVAFTVLDVLGYLDEIPVCVGYEIDGQVTREFPTTSMLEKARPVLTRLPGWKCGIRGIKRYQDLPENCRKYIEFVEKAIEAPISMVSNGPGRDDIIMRR